MDPVAEGSSYRSGSAFVRLYRRQVIFGYRKVGGNPLPKEGECRVYATPL
jgi:hypothetical protein